jgi:hypothetical protein
MKSSKANNRALLLQKIFAVMKAIPALEKTGEMKGDGPDAETQYKYHEADGIRGPFRRELLKNRLLCLPIEAEPHQWGNPTSLGGTFNYSQQKITYEFTDIDTGESYRCQAIGWGGDALDKAAPKASIQALKYFLVNGFFVSGIELDGDSPEEQNAAKNANKTAVFLSGDADVFIGDGGTDRSWILVDGTRAFTDGKNRKISGQLKSIHKRLAANERISVKVRGYIGRLNGDATDKTIIEKIEILESSEPAEIIQQ